MQLKMWTYDLAREQCPSYEFLDGLCQMSLEAGYNALGLYLEHRFIYPSTPWANGKGALPIEWVQRLQHQHQDLMLVPFINLLGHFEGFNHTEHGKRYAEESFKGLMACPSKAELVELAHKMLEDTLKIFSSPIVHIGGDEAAQLGNCPECAARVKAFEAVEGVDGKARLYGEHMRALAQTVIAAGRQPAIWGDMLLEHPQAAEYIPAETLVFDWQYFDSPATSSKTLSKTHKVVLCPTLHTYNASWLHLEASEKNLREHLEMAEGSEGVCLTTWECALFGNYASLFPAIRAAGELMNGRKTDFLTSYGSAGPSGRTWAELMGVELEKVGGMFASGKIRSSLKCRLLLYGNPFLAWMHHGKELSGPVGDRAIEISTRALGFATDANQRGISTFVLKAVEFVRLAEQARQAYAESLPGVALSCLAPCRQIFEDLEKVAHASHLNAGGSLADIERCRVAKEHVERVIRRIKDYGDGSLGYLPSFEMITHPKFMPHDQGAWWLVNTWANQ